MKYTIYKATCIVNNKSYIGFTSRWPYRKYDHFNKSKNNFPFQLALNKHGKENFEWSILYQSDDLRHTLDIMEPLYILIYDSYLNGYNLTTGGEGAPGKKITKETKIKMSKAKQGKYLGSNNPNYGNKWTNEQKQNISQKNKGRLIGNNNPMFGKHRPEVSERNKLPKFWVNNKTINRLILCEELEKYIELGFQKGMLKS